MGQVVLAQIFNRIDLRKKTEDGSLGIPTHEPLGEERQDLHYFLLRDNAFVLMPWMVKPYIRRQLTRKTEYPNTGFPEAGEWWKTPLES